MQVRAATLDDAEQLGELFNAYRMFYKQGKPLYFSVLR
jgi:hypothetical protein